jgi:hypothetical protein
LLLVLAVLLFPPLLPPLPPLLLLGTSEASGCASAAS